MPALSVRPARLLLVVMLALTVTACASVSSLEAPEVRVTGLTMLEAEPGSMEQRFLVSLRLTNPNNRSIVIDGLDFELDINDRRLARGVAGERFELPRLGEADTSVVVTTSLFDVLRQVMALGNKRDGGLDYRLRGRLHLGSGLVRTLPFDHRGRLAP
jgi:LEA14-like dessication related protein